MTDRAGLLLGQIAIQQGYVTEAQVQECLMVQAQLGGHPNLGGLLLQRGYLDEAALEKVVALQKEREAASPAPQPLPPAEAPAAPAKGRITHILEMAEKRAGSDVHFHPGAPLAMRAGGRLLAANQPPLDDAELRPQLLALLDADGRARLAAEQSLDALVTTPSGLRCRASFYFTHPGLNATFRLIRRAPPTLEELGLPRQVASFIAYSQGMVLVTGLAG
ncbi:MAG TPA: hypothetical protein VIR81_14640, partial [Myxococcales bacterium]